MLNFLEDAVRPARNIVVAFTGISQGLGGVPFEFYKSLGRIDCAALFVNDLACRWYQYDGEEISSAVNHIKRVIESTGATRSLFLGNSMGGFGALLFGKLCGADAILSLVPQTAIDPVVTEVIGDRRWKDYQASIPAYPYGDLALLSPPTARVVFCCGSDDALDVAHVNRLAAKWPGEKMIVPGAGHDAAAHLKKHDLLLPLIASHLA